MPKMEKSALQPAQHPTEGGRGARWMVVIHNNDHNSFDEVIDVLVCATGCCVEEAAIEAWEAHHYGKAPVHFAEQTECSEAATIISRVGIVTEVMPEWSE